MVRYCFSLNSFSLNSFNLNSFNLNFFGLNPFSLYFFSLNSFWPRKRRWAARIAMGIVERRRLVGYKRRGVESIRIDALS